MKIKCEKCKVQFETELIKGGVFDKGDKYMCPYCGNLVPKL